MTSLSITPPSTPPPASADDYEKLFRAALDDDADRIQELFSGQTVNLDVNHQNREGMTALHKATHTFSNGALAFLLTLPGVNPNRATYRHGITALHVASGSGNTVAMELLIARSAQVDSQTQSGKTPLDFAREAGCSRAIEILRANSPHDDL